MELRDGQKVLSSASQDAQIAEEGTLVPLTNLGDIELWDLEHPKLYSVTAQLYDGAKLSDEYATRVGFREARFTPDGFRLNGKHGQAARPQPAPDLSLRGRGDAGARAASRRADPQEGAEV